MVGGLFLAFNSQFKVDDFIHIGDVAGFVHRVALRYTTVFTIDGTKVYVPNSFFLYKPMVNLTQRPKRELDVQVCVAPTTPVYKLRECIARIEHMLQTLHVGLTSHPENKTDTKQQQLAHHQHQQQQQQQQTQQQQQQTQQQQAAGDKWPHFFFVAMEQLYTIRVYSYTDELDPRKHALIKSEVWLAVMEITEQLQIQVLTDRRHVVVPSAKAKASGGSSDSPFTAEMNLVVGAADMTTFH